MRKTKAIYTRQFLGEILGICLVLSGCASSAPEASETPSPEETPAVSVSYAQFENRRVVSDHDLVLYRKDMDQFVETGMVSAGEELDIDSVSGEYLHLADSVFYVNGRDVNFSERWISKKTELLDSGEQLTTQQEYSLQDFSGRMIAEVSGSDSYSVYKFPSASDPRYGIRMENMICYISSEDISDAPADRINNEQELPVLMYHFFYSEEKGEERPDANYVEVKEFAEQMDYLKENDYHTLNMQDVLHFMEGSAQIPEKSVVITIDDGDPSVHEYAYPVLRDNSQHAVLFLITGWGNQSLQNYDFWEMREDGLELQSHGFLTHQGGCSGMGHGGRLLCMDFEDGVEDTRMSFDAVDGGFVYCYPFGDYNDNARQILSAAGTRMAFTTEYGKIRPYMDMLALPRIRVHGGAGLERFISSIEE